jgi:hypothetical protein
MTRVDDEGGKGRLHRNERDRGEELSGNWTEAAPALPVPGKATLASRLPLAAPEAAAHNAVRAALGATQRVSTWVPQLMAAVAAASYAEAGRLSFEIRSALRRAHLDLAELERKAPEHATAIAELIEEARTQLHAAEQEAAMLLRAAPVLEDPQSASAEAEAAWTEARSGWQQDAASMSSALGLGEVTVHSDDVARSVTDAKAARGVALGDAVYMHPSRVRPGTTEGREVLAHELVHLAQARLPRDAGSGRAAAEREAAALAPTLARGGGARPSHFIDLSHAAADRDAAQEIATTAAEPTLPPGVDYQVVDGFDAVLVNRLWLTGSARGRAMQPGRMSVILGALRAAGRLGWADEADLAALATLPTQISAEHTTKVVRIDLAASAYFAVGLPPGASSIVSANGDGLEITTRLPGIAADAHGPRALDADAKQELITAIEAAVGIAVTAEGSERFLAMDLHPVVRHGAIWIRLSGEDCRALFDAEQWNAHKARNQKTDAPSVAARGAAEPTASAELGPDEREWLDRWCAAHLFKGIGAAPTVMLYQLARRIDAAGDARDAILGRLRAELAADKPVDAAALERALYEGQVDAARITAGLDPLVSGDRDAAPLYQVPLPARIVPHATEILDGDRIPLELAVDWPAEHLSLLDQLARQHTNPFQVEVDWVIARLDGSDRTVAHAAGATEALSRSQRFKLQANETRGTWTVQAFIRSTYFYPAAVATQIEVLTEAARLAELRAEAMGDLGGDAVTQAAHDFDIGVVDDSVSPDRDDHGVRLAGELPPGYAAPTDAERAENRARERETQTQLLAYLEQNAPEATDAIDAVKRSLARMDLVEKTLASDVTGGWRSFQVRGTYLSRDADVPSGPLDLYGTVEYQTHVELDPSEQREQTPPKVVSGVAVRLRDLSRRFENAAPIYTGFAPTFEAAFEAAFVALCKAYPDGKVSVLAEELDADGSDRTGKTVGFELGTSSRLERVKQAVWDPAVNLIVNAAAIAMMVFAPHTTPIAFALLAANNTLRTVDELRSLAERGLLTDHKIKMSMASIAFDILPFAKYAKVVRSNDWVRYAIESTDHGGQVALMTHEVRDLAIQLQEQDVMALAEMYRGLTELERTSHPSDPRLEQRRDELEERAREVGTRGYDAFTRVAGTRGLFMVASHQFQKLAAAAADATGAGQGRRVEVGVDDVGPAVKEAGTDTASSEQAASGTQSSPSLRSLADQAYQRYEPVVAQAESQLQALLGDLGEVHARAKDPASAANRLERAVERFGAKVTDVDSAVANLWDAVGTRIVVANPTPEVMAEIVQRLTAAIEAGQMKVTMANNLWAKDGIPYLSGDQMQAIAQSARKATGNSIEVHQHKVLDGGFTCVALYVELPGDVKGEIQIIGRQVMDVASVEHLPYDVGLGKPLVRNVDSATEPELRAIVAPVEAAMRTVNADPKLKTAYEQYLTDLYRFARQLELGEVTTAPQLPAGIDAVLSREGLEKVQSEIEALTRKRIASEPAKQAPQPGIRPTAGGDTRNGVPTSVPIDAAELRAFVAAKHADVVQRYRSAQRTADAAYEPLLAELRKCSPGELGAEVNKVKAKETMQRFVQITKAVEAQTGSKESIELRTMYNKVEVEDFPRWQEACAHLSSEQRAKLATMHREELRLYTRDLMTDENAKEALYLRDLAVYGRRQGPSYDYLFEKSMSNPNVVGDGSFDARSEAANRNIVDGSTRTSPAVNEGFTGNKSGIADPAAKGPTEQ